MQLLLATGLPWPDIVKITGSWKQTNLHLGGAVIVLMCYVEISQLRYFTIYEFTTLLKEANAFSPWSLAWDYIWTDQPMPWFRASVYTIKKWPQKDLCCDAQGQNQTALTRHWAVRIRLNVWVCRCCTLRFLRVDLVGCRILCWDRVVAL